MRKATKRRSDEATKGFTLVEMVIVIGVIILLAALTLSVSVAVIEGAEVRRTENTIQLLTAAIQEWETQADRRVTYGINGEPYNQGEQYEIRRNEVNNDHEATAWLFAIISRPTAVKQILAQVDPEFVKSIDDLADPNDTSRMLVTFEFTDAWGNPIVAVFPGRTWADGFDLINDQDADGTLRTAIEKACGIAANRQVCFVSAGPDGELGDLSSGNPDDVDEADDNIFSYAPAESTTP
ncbi:MAG: type II secretion system protein [Planctomycetota bacterium]|jgi:type II secretory pathway pseudopilin PulG